MMRKEKGKEKSFNAICFQTTFLSFAHFIFSLSRNSKEAAKAERRKRGKSHYTNQTQVFHLPISVFYYYQTIHQTREGNVFVCKYKILIFRHEFMADTSHA